MRIRKLGARARDKAIGRWSRETFGLEAEKLLIARQTNYRCVSEAFRLTLFSAARTNKTQIYTLCSHVFVSFSFLSLCARPKQSEERRK
jgi:hypothetical protein